MLLQALAVNYVQRRPQNSWRPGPSQECRPFDQLPQISFYKQLNPILIPIYLQPRFAFKCACRAYLQEHQMFETQYLAFKRMSRLFPLSLNSITIKYMGKEKGSSTNVLQAILLNISASGP